MATKSKTVDWGGLTLVVNDVQVGATKPGQTGTALSSTELSLLDGVTAGTITASKVVTADASGNVPWRRHVVEDGAAVTLTAIQSGALCVFDKTDGALFTLPAPAIGLFFDFAVDTVVSSGSAKVITNAGTVFIKGTVNAFVTGTDADLAADAANGSTHVAVTMNGTTTGGIAGTRFRLTCRSATVWEVEGDIIKSGSVATSFTTS